LLHPAPEEDKGGLLLLMLAECIPGLCVNKICKIKYYPPLIGLANDVTVGIRQSPTAKQSACHQNHSATHPIQSKTIAT
jgi:hypothetical protein